MIGLYILVLPLIDILTIPDGWSRVMPEPGSFGEYLHQLSFEITDSTYFWDGTASIYHSVAAVHKFKGLTEIEQCADVIMRFYSDFIKSKGQVVSWHDVQGNLKTWNGMDYAKFMRDIYNYSNTYSLYKFDSFPVKVNDAKPGDILVIPGFPGHIVLIVDVLKKDDKIKLAVVEGFTPAVQPFLYRPGPELHLTWNNGISVSGYSFAGENLRRIK
ncbi:MAG TPA: DUF4846 domain-containing protein [Cyclobacteriaceae bacterium]|nr:DUF4846 domain-containing protein [Cyclobacteriaceae bacterium]